MSDEQPPGGSYARSGAMMPMEGGMDVGVLTNRLQRLVMLDTTVFEEVRSEQSATLPSIMVVIVATLLAGIGGWLWWIQEVDYNTGKVFFQSVVMGTIFSVALWIVWLLVAWVVLTQVFRQTADWQQMLRTMGLAAAPLALSIGVAIPELDFGIGLASIALMFGLTTIAIQSTTQATQAQVLAANLFGFAVWAIVLSLLVTTDSYLAPGIFLRAIY
jgi:hypothetical protein